MGNAHVLQLAIVALGQFGPLADTLGPEAEQLADLGDAARGFRRTGRGKRTARI